MSMTVAGMLMLEEINLISTVDGGILIFVNEWQSMNAYLYMALRPLQRTTSFSAVQSLNALMSMEVTVHGM